MFRGSITAIVTPFKNNEIDYKAFDNLIEFQIESGTHGIVVCGTTGESPTLSHQEHEDIVKRCIDVVKGRVPVIAGTGSNSTKEAIDMTQAAKDDGADGALIVSPYYNKPIQAGLYEHFRTIAETVDIPIIIYNIPGRSAVDITNDTIARLAELDNIVGVKDATGDLSRPKDLLKKTGPDFIQLSGEDAAALSLLKSGGHGCISVTSNVAPAQCAAMQDAWQNGEEDKAEKIFESLLPLHETLFTETNPSPVKYVLAKLGLCTDEVRLPLVPASPSCRDILDEAMEKCGIEAGTAGTPKKAAHG